MNKPCICLPFGFVSGEHTTPVTPSRYFCVRVWGGIPGSANVFDSISEPSPKIHAQRCMNDYCFFRHANFPKQFDTAHLLWKWMKMVSTGPKPTETLRLMEMLVISDHVFNCGMGMAGNLP